jgi:hypothetical protein
MGQVTGGGSYAYGTEVTIEARAFGGYHFNGWDDGVQEEQRTVTVTADASYLAIFEPNVGIEMVGSFPLVYVSGKEIVVSGAAGHTITVYDVVGRRIGAIERAADRQTFKVPVAGVYIVRIEAYKPQKCLVR